MRYLKHAPWIAFLVALAPAFVAAWPLFGARFIPTHDGEYHIIRFWQFSTMLASGQWFPRWAPDLNNGLGIPLFTFNYPFPNYVGSLFHALGLSFVDSFKWTMALGYLSATAFCFLWLRRIVPLIPSVIGTVVCAYVPYWFIDLYIRGSVGEIWALAWVFAVLSAMAAGYRIGVTIGIAMLIVSHNILAFLFVPFLAAYSLYTGRGRISDIVLGVGAASFFWIPALYEQRYIVGLRTVNVHDYFPEIWQLLIPSWGSGFRGQVTGGNEMSYQIGIVPGIVWVAAVIGIMASRKKRMRDVTYWCVMFLCAVLLMIPVSAPVWDAVPFVHFIQYPWRLLSVVVVAVPMLAAFVTQRFRFGWVVVMCAVIAAYGYSRPVTYEPRADAHYLTNPSFTGGTSSLGDAFQTRWMHGDATGGFSFPDGAVTATTLSPVSYAVSVRAGSPGTLAAPIAYYPGWQARMDGTDIPVTPDSNGRVSVSVPEGDHAVVFRLGSTWWQTAASWISVISLSALSVSFILRKSGAMTPGTSPAKRDHNI